jgi:hypothetical protein
MRPRPAARVGRDRASILAGREALENVLASNDVRGDQVELIACGLRIADFSFRPSKASQAPTEKESEQRPGALHAGRRASQSRMKTVCVPISVPQFPPPSPFPSPSPLCQRMSIDRGAWGQRVGSGAWGQARGVSQDAWGHIR